MAGKEYDDIAENIFAPIFPIIADTMVRRTGVTAGNMLDIGCGGGHMGFAVMDKIPVKGYFMDILPEAVGICQERGERLGYTGHFWVQQGDVHHMPYSDGFAQLIVSRGSIGFWGAYHQAFQEIYRVLAPGGKAFVGSGLGNRETKKNIDRQMKQRDPDWPHSIKRSQHSVSTQEFLGIFKDVGFSAQVIENEDEGRWFILEKKEP